MKDQEKDDICIFDYHRGYYLDLVKSHDNTWSFYYGKSPNRQCVSGLNYDEGKKMLYGTLLSSRLISELIWEDDIQSPRMFE